jgi:alcohol dehydrogenase (NADP+)
VAVLGIEPVGLSAIAGAKLRGARRIFAVGTRLADIKVAKAYGATDIVSYREGDTAEQIRNSTGGAGVDAVIVAGGGPEVMMDAINAAKPGSVISNVNYFGRGMGDQDIIPLPRVAWGFDMAERNIMTGLCPGGRVRMERLAEVVMHGRMDPSLMATHIFRGFDQLEKALLLMKETSRDLIKPVVLVEQ